MIRMAIQKYSIRLGFLGGVIGLVLGAYILSAMILVLK
jgi:hypothetical protein